jgi:hypothetical protein
VKDEKNNAQLREETSEKTIDSLPRRYAIGTLAPSSTTPCALHSNTTSLHVHGCQNMSGPISKYFL